MNRTFVASLVAATALALLVLAFAAKNRIPSIPVVHAQSGCGDATLTGNYGFSDSGFFASKSRNGAGNEVPLSAVGMFTFDGAGNASVSYTIAANGTINTNASGSGTYTISSACTGLISFTAGDAAGVAYNIVVVNGATEVLGIPTVAGTTQTLDAKKQ